MQCVIHLEIEASVPGDAPDADGHGESASVGRSDEMLLDGLADVVGQHICVAQSAGSGNNRKFLAAKAAE